MARPKQDTRQELTLRARLGYLHNVKKFKWLIKTVLHKTCVWFSQINDRQI